MLTRTMRVGILVAATASGSAWGQIVTTELGIDWITIGHAGNRNTIESEMFTIPGFKEPVGGVNYEYRIMRTQVDAGLHAEFLNAYRPFIPAGQNPVSFDLVGPWIGFNVSEDRYRPIAGFENLPTKMNWRNIARMANWLHNGKVSEAWAFEDGVYDTSTFGLELGVGYTDQRQRHPGAKVWIPTEDEWVKAMHYDPDRYGAGQEGYWRFAHGSDSPPIAALPEHGGETDGSLGWDAFLAFPLPVDTYPNAASPFGVAGGNGGYREALETNWITLNDDSGMRVFRGGDFDYPFDFAGLDSRSRLDQGISISGFRFAMVVPAPGSLAAIGCAMIFAARRRR
jgi:hypothetical protein